MQKSGISNDHSEYVMNCRASRANQHAEKCVNGAWLPMRVPEKGVWEELEQKIFVTCGLEEKVKKWLTEMVSTAFQWSHFFLNLLHFEECQWSIVWMLHTI